MMFQDSQAMPDSQPLSQPNSQLTDSDPDVSPPKKRLCGMSIDRKKSGFFETAKSILVKNLSDSDNDGEDEPSEIEIEEKDPSHLWEGALP